MLDVFLHGDRVGTIGYSASGISVFTFAEDYLANPQRATLSQSMLGDNGEPRAPRRSAFARLPAFFSNLLPEGRLRTYLAERAGIDERDETAILAALGDDLPGALTVRSDTEPPSGAHPPPASGESEPLRFSLAGVQLKFSAFATTDRKGLTIPVRGSGGNWILKLPSRRFDGVPEAEAATMSFAASVGIDVPEHRLVSVADIFGLPSGIEEFDVAYAVKRYDRTDDAELIHQEDFAQVLSAYPNEKYRAPRMAPIAAIIARACGLDDADEFTRRLVFSIGVGNGDLHLKNISLIYPDRRSPRLAPAYDIVPTGRYISGDGLAIPIVRAKRWDAIDEGEFLDFADAAGLSRKRTIATVRDTVERMRAAWPTVRDREPFDDPTRQFIEQQFAHVPLFGGQPKRAPRSPRANRRH